METMHNHPPRCCCISEDAGATENSYRMDRCPMCVEHGDLAQLGAECPCCHQLVGRPHTDYCPAYPIVGADPRDHTTQPEPARPACSTPTRDMGDGRGCGDWECPRHGNPEWKLTPDDREAIETALQAAERGDAGHWPTVASWLALEIRRLRGDQP